MKKVCGEPYCARLTDGKYCPEHGTIRQPYCGNSPYRRRHERWAQAVLARDRHCPCGARATHADHIVPLSQGGDWSESNGRGLCSSCHARKSNQDRKTMRVEGIAGVQNLSGPPTAGAEGSPSFPPRIGQTGAGRKGWLA
jgi:5-methylcytosine-specific restriction protein A